MLHGTGHYKATGATHNEVHQYTNNEQHIMITYDFSANGHYMGEKD